jgi:erythromycin esterase-like protein
MARRALDGALFRRLIDDPDRIRPTGSDGRAAAALLRAAGEPFTSIREASMSSLLERIGEARVVLLGEATHGTSEFYRMRAHITKALIEKKGFTMVAIEGDWPDAALIDGWVRRLRPAASIAAEPAPFSRFPTWMWRNREVLAFVEWLREHNQGRRAAERVGFHGLDLYSMKRSMRAVLAYLERVDPPAARRARERYQCLLPWQDDLGAYSAALRLNDAPTCEEAVLETLADLRALPQERDALAGDDDSGARDGEERFDALMNARLIVSAEAYGRALLEGRAASWNLRDTHMVDALEELLRRRAPSSSDGRPARAVVWAHNSHVGDASHTEMGRRGEVNVGMLARERFGRAAYIVGFGTDRGTVLAADEWEGPHETKAVLPSRADSWERACHDAGIPAFLLHLREPAQPAFERELRAMGEHLERAIGVIYRPRTERWSHYFSAFAAAVRQLRLLRRDERRPRARRAARARRATARRRPAGDLPLRPLTT